MKAQVISFKCILKNKLGNLISTTFNRDVVTAIENNSVPLIGLAKGLQNLKKGELRKISLSAQEAYGLYDPKKVILYPKKMIQGHPRIGDNVTVVNRFGVSRSYRVTQFHGNMVMLDSNHPLAGQDLVFEIETIDAREASDEDLAEITNVMSSQKFH